MCVCGCVCVCVCVCRYIQTESLSLFIDRVSVYVDRLAENARVGSGSESFAGI
jgi:hypothetical protein